MHSRESTQQSYINVFGFKYIRVYPDNNAIYFSGRLSRRTLSKLAELCVDLAAQNIVVKPSEFDRFVKTMRKQGFKPRVKNGRLIIKYFELRFNLIRGARKYRAEQKRREEELMDLAISLMLKHSFTALDAAKHVGVSYYSLLRYIKRTGLAPKKLKNKAVVVQAAKNMRERGYSIREIARILGVPKSTIHRWLKP